MRKVYRVVGYVTIEAPNMEAIDRTMNTILVEIEGMCNYGYDTDEIIVGIDDLDYDAA